MGFDGQALERCFKVTGLQGAAYGDDVPRHVELVGWSLSGYFFLCKTDARSWLSHGPKRGLTTCTEQQQARCCLCFVCAHHRSYQANGVCARAGGLARWACTSDFDSMGRLTAKCIRGLPGVSGVRDGLGRNACR